VKALTIKQPYADAIAHGAKRTENRSRPIPAKHIGARILIHAGLTDDRDAVLCRGTDWPDTRGAVIATARLVGCHQANPTGILCCAPWGFEGAWHWQLADVQPLPVPVACRGQLGLWTPSPDVLAAVHAGLATTGTGVR
jgi:hypothetical protein